MTEPEHVETMIRLEGPLTLQTAQELRDRLLAALAQPGDIRVDCSAVNEADLSAIQLLLAARRSAARDGRRLTLTGAAAGPLHDILCQAGFIGENSDATADSEFFKMSA